MTEEDYHDLIDRVLRLEAGQAMPAKEYLTAKEAAEFTSFSKIQLDEWRSKGGGPKFLKIGRRVTYRISDLRAFMDAHLVGRSRDAA